MYRNGSARELTLSTGREIVLGKRKTYSERLEANEQRCLNYVRGSGWKHVQRLVNLSIDKLY